MELSRERAKNERLEEENKKIKEGVKDLEIEEEHITNALLKRIETMSLEKQKLLLQIDAEEEHMTNALQRKLDDLAKEKVELERQLEVEQEYVGNKLQRQVDALKRDKMQLTKEREKLTKKIENLSSESSKLRREKVEIEHTLETEEENIVNTLQGQIQKLLKQNLTLERKLQRLQGGQLSAISGTSDSEQSEDGLSSYSARGLASYLSSSPRSTRSGSHGVGRASRGEFIQTWQRGALQAQSHSGTKDTSTAGTKEGSADIGGTTKSTKQKRDTQISTDSQSGSQRESLDIPQSLGGSSKSYQPHRTTTGFTTGPGSVYSQSSMRTERTDASTKGGNDTPMSLPTTPRSGTSLQNQDSELEY